MDPRINPYAPGAGTIPPELSGRQEIIQNISIQLDRCRNGLAYRSFLMVGLRGVGKTVLLNHLAQNAEAEGFVVTSIETPEKRSLPALLIPSLRSILLTLDRLKATGEKVKKAIKVLGSFTKAMKAKYHDIEFSLDLGSEEGLADTGVLENDLIELFIILGKAAQEKNTAIVIFIDELQYIEESEFASLIMAVHKCTQLQLPITIVGAGLPQLVAQAGRAKSYAERLFEYPEIGPLDDDAARYALTSPAKKLGVTFEKAALDEILKQTEGYPYFLQEWGKHSWLRADESPITVANVKDATDFAIVELDKSFFRARFDRLTTREKQYLRAMAEISHYPIRSGDIAQLLEKDVKAVAPFRATLIAKGMIYSPDHGNNKFTVPLFADFMKRVMPDVSLME